MFIPLSFRRHMSAMQVAEDFSVSFGIAMPVFDGSGAIAALLGVLYLQSNPAQTLFPKMNDSPGERAAGETLH
jgi:DNA-binding IclR family transcriptional regulator